MKFLLLVNVFLHLVYLSLFSQSININKNVNRVFLDEFEKFQLDNVNNSKEDFFYERVRNFNINDKVFSNACVGDTIILDIFEDKKFIAVVSKLHYDLYNTKSVVANIIGYKYAYSIFTKPNVGKSFVFIEIPENDEQYITRPCSFSDMIYIGKIDNINSLFPPSKHPVNNYFEEIKVNDNKINILSNRSREKSIVDVMVIYTPEASVWALENEGSINNTIVAMMEKSQLVLDNSNTQISLNLVHTEEVDYQEAENTNIDLDRLTFHSGYDPFNSEGEPRYLEEVHDWRNQYGADLVLFLIKTNEVGGKGWQLNNPSGNPNMGFSLVRVQSATSKYVGVHEIGHNMGAHHHKEQNFQPGPGVFSYSAGWRWIDSDSSRYCSVMTYEGGSYYSDGLVHLNVPLFSNPDINYNFVPSGNYIDGDNARTLREIRSVISNYKSVSCTHFPSLQADSISFYNIMDNEISLNWKRGNGDKVIVLAREKDSVGISPTNSKNYYANSIFGEGDSIANTNYVVYIGSDTSVTVSGLKPGTEYYFEIFEFFDGVFCYANPGYKRNIKTSGIPPLCEFCYSWGFLSTNTSITNVTFNTINNSSGKDEDLNGNAYSDFTNIKTDLFKGETYYLSIRLRGSTEVFVSVWIDWNKDCDFDYENEMYFLGSINDQNDKLTLKSPMAITIPENSDTGEIIMRVIAMNSVAPSSHCLKDFFDIEVEDYVLNIKNNNCKYPTVQTSNLRIDDIGVNNMLVKWDRGDGDGVVIVAKEKSSLESKPKDGVEYNYSLNYGEGDELGFENYIIYDGQADSVLINGLKELKKYDISAFEYTNEDYRCYLKTEEKVEATTLMRPPINVIADKISNNSVRLTWTHPLILVFDNEIWYKHYDIEEMINDYDGNSSLMCSAFDDNNFDFVFPIRINSIRHAFADDTDWTNSNFKFLILSYDTSTILYESPILSAIANDYVEHKITDSLIVYNRFFIAVELLSEDGTPKSKFLKTSIYDSKSFGFSDGKWEFVKDEKDNVYDICQGVKIDSLFVNGYKVYRNDEEIAEKYSFYDFEYFDNDIPKELIYYYVKAFYSEGISSISNIATIDNKTSVYSIHETDESLVRVFPNAANNEIYINITDIKDYVDFEIINSIGKVVYSEKINDNKILNINNFNDGIYLMIFNVNGEKQIMKIIIKKSK